MKILILSDLHNEFDMYRHAGCGEDVVILAGDIDIETRGIRWAAENFSCPVIYICGNHEFYHGHLDKTVLKVKGVAQSRVHALDNEEIIINGVRFLGGTAWTDYKATSNLYEAQELARWRMRDFQLIRAENYRKIRPHDLMRRAVDFKIWLESKLSEPFPGKTVVVSHHAPLLASLNGSPHRGTHLDASFANDWSELFASRIDLWVHGHTHQFCDYVHGATRVVCNPRGYPGELTGFRSDFLVDL
ncbi:Metallophosphoesterase [Pseudomonas knackmussii B13]|uniref:Metallophosphoesterase n=1 Tax=Pseudomonas knackmussii (strain DSM 6978 / CCUG 54928 / LMG 23759 / B13) TaxID=1301098 RepID=A0A024HLK0_PSEKB|nr:metallophosphoesterase [Pseudomonas knackmussii]CDF85741.1 Metallophosphoesterase [Pseudomonas knackmussii B13]